jgi:hypothetical protein
MNYRFWTWDWAFWQWPGRIHNLENDVTCGGQLDDERHENEDETIAGLAGRLAALEATVKKLDNLDAMLTAEKEAMRRRAARK